ncbi:MAG: flagellar export protein FliJ [Planctomycetes bacterium]|nr:flagellar export protein FliJ [Planctomycetota bacterium]
MAKKFNFRLQPVLKYRQWIEDETRKRFLEIQRVRNEKQHELDGLRDDTQKAVNAMVDAKTGNVDVHRVRTLNRYITGLNISTMQREGELRAIDGEVDKRRDEFVAARRGVKSMEKLKERRVREHDYEEVREMTKELDESGANGQRRKKLVDQQDG